MSQERTQYWLGLLLAALTVAIPLGEGVGLLALGLLMVATCLGHRHIQWQALTERPAAYWWAGWAGWALFGAGAALVGGEGLLRPQELGRHLPMLAAPTVFLAVRALSPSITQRAFAVGMSVLLISALLGVFQWASGEHALSYLARPDTSVLTQSRVPGNFDAAVAGGFYFHRLKMAHVLVLGLGILVALLLGHPACRRGRTRYGVMLMASMLFLCLLGTFTKAALGATVLAALFVAMKALGGRILPLLAILSLMVAATIWQMGGFGFPENAGSSASVEARRLIWSQAKRVMEDYPWGVGLGNYSQVIARYYDQVAPAFHIRTYPHHLFLSWWVEAGLGGALVLSMGWASTLLHSWRKISNLSEPSTARTASIGLSFYLVAFWVIGNVHDVLYHPSVALMFFTGVGWFLAQLTHHGAGQTG